MFRVSSAAACSPQPSCSRRPAGSWAGWPGRPPHHKRQGQPVQLVIWLQSQHFRMPGRVILMTKTTLIHLYARHCAAFFRSNPSCRSVTPKDCGAPVPPSARISTAVPSRPGVHGLGCAVSSQPIYILAGLSQWAAYTTVPRIAPPLYTRRQ